MPTQNEIDQYEVVFNLVLKMRKAQIEFYVHRISNSVHRMKKFERDVDAAVKQMNQVKITKQLSL